MLVRAIVADQNQPMQIIYNLSPKQGEPVLEGAMKVHYDPETDTLTMRLSEHPVMESDEASPAGH